LLLLFLLFLLLGYLAVQEVEVEAILKALWTDGVSMGWVIIIRHWAVP
jgi:hypothetical protein